MKYEVRVQKRHEPDVVITVEEGDVSNIVTSWCSRGYGCIVIPKRSWGDEISKSSEKKPKCDWSCKEALDFANTLANHGWTGEANADAASSCIYALCRTIKKLTPCPDPDWKAICEKCIDGEIEPECKYYGEPNGCNSPIYGEHPKENHGNSAALREAVEYLLEQRDILDFCHNNLGSKTYEDWDKVYRVLRKIIEKAMRAMSAPPRNCDIYDSESCRMAYHLHGDGIMTMQAFADWLFDAAKESGVENA